MNIVGQRRILGYIRLWEVSGLKQNLLLRGPAGMGKTLIAEEYAKRMCGSFYHYTICKQGKRLCPPPDQEPVVLDEIHRLSNEEDWYSTPNLLIGCTTEGAPVSEPLLTRMFEVWLDDYSLVELKEIVRRACNIESVPARVAAKRCRGIPRTAILIGNQLRSARLAKRATARDYEKVCDEFGFFEDGYTVNDIRYLDLIRTGPKSLNTIATTLHLAKRTVEQEVEPFLFRMGRVQITSKGRSYVENRTP